MFARLHSSPKFRLAAGVLGMVLLPALALAVTLTAWAYDATRNDVYYQFSTDVPVDAWRSTVSRAGVIVRQNTWDPAGSVMGGAGEHHGLNPATSYTLRLYVRETPASAWSLMKSQGFTTLP